MAWIYTAGQHILEVVKLLWRRDNKSAVLLSVAVS